MKLRWTPTSTIPMLLKLRNLSWTFGCRWSCGVQRGTMTRSVTWAETSDAWNRYARNLKHKVKTQEILLEKWFRHYRLEEEEEAGAAVHIASTLLCATMLFGFCRFSGLGTDPLELKEKRKFCGNNFNRAWKHCDLSELCRLHETVAMTLL